MMLEKLQNFAICQKGLLVIVLRRSRTISDARKGVWFWLV